MHGDGGADGTGDEEGAGVIGWKRDKKRNKTKIVMMDNLEIIKKIKGSKKVEIIDHDKHLDDKTEDFIKRVCNAITKEHRLVPVICEDMFEYRDPKTNETQSLHSYLTEQVLNNCDDPIKFTEIQLNDIIQNEYYGMRLLEKKTKVALEELGKPIHQILFSSVDENAHLKKEVKEFLLTCRFPLVITTSCYDILEKELDGQYKPYYAKIDGSYDDKDDNPTKRKEVHSEKLPSNCIYHIFGEANTAKPDWGYSDKQIMEYLRYALAVGPWKNLTSEIKNKSLLFIGNNTPDWLFRFMLIPIYGESVYNERSGYYINSQNKLNDDHLIYFLKDISISKDSNLCMILDKITQQVRQFMPQRNNDANKPKVFLSHASEDNPIVKKMVTYLKQYFDVFVDYDDIKSGNYWAKIIKELKEAVYFIPFVTDEYLHKAKKYEDNENQRQVFEKLHIDKTTLSLDYEDKEQMERVYDLSRELGGVAVELLLAEKWYSSLNLPTTTTYSIPVVYYGFPGLDIDYVEKQGAGKVIPKCLFSSQEMVYYHDSLQDPFDGELDKRFCKTNEK